MNIRKIFRKKYRDYEVEPDEIFLDAKNMPNFNRQQFEGRMERSISKNAVKISFAFFLAVVAIFSGDGFSLFGFLSKRNNGQEILNRLNKLPVICKIRSSVARRIDKRNNENATKRPKGPNRCDKNKELK